MTTYHLWINCCAGINETETPEACGTCITDCKHTSYLKVESDAPLEELFEQLKRDYNIPSCPIGKAERYFATKPSTDLQTNGHKILTIDDLIPKGSRERITAALKKNR